MDINNLVEAVSRYANYGRKDDGEVRFTALLAYYLGSSLPIPGVRVPSPESFYRETVLGNVKEITNALNEKLIIRVPEVMDLTQKLWLTRYYMVHPVARWESCLVVSAEHIPPIFLKELAPIVESIHIGESDAIVPRVKQRYQLLRAFIGYFSEGV